MTSYHHDSDNKVVLPSAAQRGFNVNLLREKGTLLAITVFLCSVVVSILFIDFSPYLQQTKVIIITSAFSVLAVISRTLEKKLGYSAYQRRFAWFDFGASLLLILTVISHPLLGIMTIILAEFASRYIAKIKDQRPQATVVNMASDAIGVVAAVSIFHVLTTSQHELSSSFTTVLLFGIAALTHSVVSELTNSGLFMIVDGFKQRDNLFKALLDEYRTTAVFTAGYIAVTMAISSTYLTSNIPATILCATTLIGSIFLFRLWGAANRRTKLAEKALATEKYEPVSWTLASMVFKVLHTNQDRFVRHSLATARLCELVAKELNHHTSDSLNPEEAWVVGVLHDIALMDQPVQVLRRAERLERPVDVEVYENDSHGRRFCFNTEESQLPGLTDDDFNLLDAHPQIGAELLAGWPTIAETIQQHHTPIVDYDTLPLLGKILYVCEKYELTASKDGYYAALSKDDALYALKESYEFTIKEGYGHMVKDHPQVFQALETVLNEHTEAFWDATDLDYDREVQKIASRLQAYATTQKPAETEIPLQRQIVLRSFHPHAPATHATPFPQSEPEAS